MPRALRTTEDSHDMLKDRDNFQHWVSVQVQLVQLVVLSQHKCFHAEAHTVFVGLNPVML